MLKVRNPRFVNTPASVVAAVKAAMANREYESVAELGKTIPELKGKTQGEIDQVLIDSGMELVSDDQPEPPEVV